MKEMESDTSILRFDWAAKSILRQKENFDILEGMLSVFLEEKVKIECLLESESNVEFPEGKSNRVDIRAKNAKGEIILVEIQLRHDPYFMERILFSVAKTLTEHLCKGEDYSEVKKVYSFNILYYDFGQGEDYLYYGGTTFCGKHHGDIFRIGHRGEEAIRWMEAASIYPEYYILRVKAFQGEAHTPEEEWMRYLKESEIDPSTTVPGLQEAYRRLKVLQMSPKERRAYDNFLFNKVFEKNVIKGAEDIAWYEGMIKGKEEGEQKKAFEIARQLKQMNIPFTQITQATGLSAEEIEGL